MSESKNVGRTDKLEICGCLELLGLDQNSSIEDANQSYAYLFQMINLLHSTNQDADQDNRRPVKLSELEYAYKKVIDHIHTRDHIACNDGKPHGVKEQQNIVKPFTKAAIAFQNAKRDKAKADASFSAAMDEVQKTIKMKRKADIHWMEALEIWNASRSNSSKVFDTISANVRWISQIWLESERRKKPRISFLPGKNPNMTIDGRQYPVMDISHDAIRFNAGPSFVLNRIIRGRLDLQGAPSMNIVGKVIRNIDDQAAAKLITRIAEILISNYPCQSIINTSGYKSVNAF
jgi:hypothetical protein